MKALCRLRYGLLVVTQQPLLAANNCEFFKLVEKIFQGFYYVNRSSEENSILYPESFRRRLSLSALAVTAITARVFVSAP